MRFVMLLLLVTGCATPCKTVSLMSAYEAEIEQCLRLTTTKSEGYACVADVESRYLSRFADIGVEALDDLEQLRKEVER